MSKILNIAHRGARSLAPENTLPAAQKAFQIGADMWELDTGMLKDNTLIILHDNSFQRTTNVNEVFPERAKDHLTTFTKNEVDQLNAGSFFEKTDPFQMISEGAVSKEDLTAYANVSVPTLEEALLFTRENHWKVNVEIKNMKNTFADSLIADKVLTMIESLNMVGQVIISSFNHHYLKEIKTKNPAITTAALVEVSKFWDLSKCKALKTTAYNPPAYLLSRKQVQNFIRNNFNVNIWTVNELELMKKWIDAGATGIITDFPQRLKTLL